MKSKRNIPLKFIALLMLLIFAEIIILSSENRILMRFSSGESMNPTMSDNTWTVCIKQSDYNVEDIVVYKSSESVFPDNLIGHRIVWKAKNGWFEIRGDNEYMQLNEYIPAKDIICKIVYWVNI